MRLGAEHRPDLVDPLEDPDQLLLVELRALRQVRRPPEVVDGEHVGPRLGRRLDELRGRHLGEPEPVEGGPEAAQRGGRQLPPGALGRVAPQHRRVVEQGRQRDVEGGPPQLGGGRERVLGQRHHGRTGDLDAAGGLGVGRGGPGDADGGLLRGYGGARRQHHLGQAAAVAQHQEGDARQLAAPVHPALEQHLGAGRRCGQVVAERSHEYLQLGSPQTTGCSRASSRAPSSQGPWRCGRGLGRGATTPLPVDAVTARAEPLVGDAGRADGRCAAPEGRGFVRPRGRRGQRRTADGA